MARASAFQAEGRGFESRFPLQPYFGRVKLGAVLYLEFLAVSNIQNFVIYVFNFSERSYGSEVEHSLGKGEVAGSSPAMSSIDFKRL